MLPAIMLKEAAIGHSHTIVRDSIEKKWFENDPVDGMLRVIYQQKQHHLRYPVVDIPETSLLNGHGERKQTEVTISDNGGSYAALEKFFRSHYSTSLPDDSPIRMIEEAHYAIPPTSGIVRIGLHLAPEERSYISSLIQRTSKYPTLRDISKSLEAYYHSPTPVAETPHLLVAELKKSPRSRLQIETGYITPLRGVALEFGDFKQYAISPDPKSPGYPVYMAIQEMHRK